LRQFVGWVERSDIILRLAFLPTFVERHNQRHRQPNPQGKRQKRRMRPISDSRHIAMLDRIDMDIIDVTGEIIFITNGVLPVCDPSDYFVAAFASHRQQMNRHLLDFLAFLFFLSHCELSFFKSSGPRATESPSASFSSLR